MNSQHRFTGVRGALFDNRLNCFFTPQTRYNGITRNGGGIAKITDAAMPNTSLDTADDRFAVRLYRTFF